MISSTKNTKPNDALAALKNGADELGAYLDEASILAFAIYLEELKSWNKKMNLIKRKDDHEIITKDFLDSLTLSRYISPEASILDIGSGAGFPGIPLRIARRDLHVVLLEIRNKRLFFLRHMIRLLKLNNIDIASTGDEKLKDHFDFIASRALGSISKLIDSGGPYLKNGGIALSMRGKKGEEDLNRELPQLEKRGWTVSFLDKFKLPIIKHDRILIAMKKDHIEDCRKYPLPSDFGDDQDKCFT